MTIERIETARLAEVVAGLVKEGLTFTAIPNPAAFGLWTITLTGGF